MLIFYIFTFLISCFLLIISGNLVIRKLTEITKFLGWKEFVVAFVVMAFASSLPNLFVGISSALHKIPQLSFGDIMGGNVVALTLAVAISVLLSRSKGIPAESRTIQSSSIFTFVAAVLPLVLVSDGLLSRADGVVLIGFFGFYSYWLFSKKERFSKVYDGYTPPSILKELDKFLGNLGKIFLGLLVLLLSAEGIVRSASFFAGTFNIPLALIGLLIVGFGNALPETYFAAASARRGESWMILGDLMGSIIITATLVLGIVALIYPIEIADFSPFAIARFFLIISIISFFLFVRSDQKISRKEGIFLLIIYFLFIISELWFR